MNTSTPSNNWFARHKLLTGVLGIGVFFIVIIALASSGDPEGSVPTPTSVAVTESPSLPVEIATEQPSPLVEGTGTAAPQSEGILVTKVVDGDTIQLEDGTTVRYIGIDTPETVHPFKKFGCQRFACL